jgi:hypothetical protein
VMRQCTASVVIRCLPMTFNGNKTALHGWICF